MRARDDPSPSVPIGTGHAGAMWRTGLAELRNAVFPDSNVAVGHAEAGIYGTATQYEVNQERHGETIAEPVEHKSMVDDRLRQVEASRDSRGRDARETEMEKE